MQIVALISRLFPFLCNCKRKQVYWGTFQRGLSLLSRRYHIPKRVEGQPHPFPLAGKPTIAVRAIYPSCQQSSSTANDRKSFSNNSIQSTLNGNIAQGHRRGRGSEFALRRWWRLERLLRAHRGPRVLPRARCSLCRVLEIPLQTLLPGIPGKVGQSEGGTQESD